MWTQNAIKLLRAFCDYSIGSAILLCNVSKEEKGSHIDSKVHCMEAYPLYQRFEPARVTSV